MQRPGYPPTGAPYSGGQPAPGYLGAAPYPAPAATAASPTIPEIPASFPELLPKSHDELKQLVDDEDAFINFFSALAQVKQIQKDREQLAEEVEAQAKINLSMKPDLERRREHLAEVFDQLAAVRQVYDQHAGRHEELSRRFSPETIIANLRIEASKAEEESENVAEDFLSGKIPVNDFVDQFMTRKMLCHIRHAKEEKLRQGGNIGSW